MKFRKIYIEITNKCNLSCSFCSISHRELKEMSVKEFEHVLKEVSIYTKTIYLHVKGEPLYHSMLDEILSICDMYEMRVNITTNATLLEHKVEILQKHVCLRKLNISLHCETSMKDYYNRVFKAASKLENVYIVYRLWTLEDLRLNKESMKIVDAISSYYKLEEEMKNKIICEKHVQIKDHIIVDKDNMFTWPDLKNDFTHKEGYCFALKTHIAILSNGDVVPCCLDGEGVLKLGNIFEESLSSILEKEKTKRIKKSFQNRKPCETLCQKCGFLMRLDINKKQC